MATNCLHLDSTSMHLHGEHYNDGTISITVENQPSIKKPVIPLQGYLRDAHHELLQVMLQMITDEN